MERKTFVLDAFFLLYTEMEDRVNGELDLQPEGNDFSKVIHLIVETIRSLQGKVGDFLEDEPSEVLFFRQIWPKFYSRLFFYLLVHEFHFNRMLTSSDQLDDFIREEKEKGAVFLRDNAEFWLYYRSGNSKIDVSFTRRYSASSVFDPLCLVLDPNGATLASFTAAWGLAYEAR